MIAVSLILFCCLVASLFVLAKIANKAETPIATLRSEIEKEAAGKLWLSAYN